MIEMWSGRAAAGDAAAQYQLGACLEMGIGAAVDLAAACTWYRRAAAQGHARAQYSLGLACSFGAPGVPWDLAEACKWLTLAKRNGLVEAAEAMNQLKAPYEKRAFGEKMAREFVAVREAGNQSDINASTETVAFAVTPQSTPEPADIQRGVQLGFNFNL